MRRLSRKLELEAVTRNADGAGGYTGDWSVLGTHWAAVEPRTGRLEAGEGHGMSRGAYRIVIRAVPPTSPSRPKAGQRFREGTRLFEIRSVMDAKDIRYLWCFADEEEAT